MGRVPVKENPKDSPKRAAVIKIDVEGHSVWALIDSGADVSMIGSDFAQKVIPKESQQKGSFGTITQAGGQKIPVTSRAEVTFQLQTENFIHNMVIIPNLIYQVVLGRDFCCQHETILDDRSGSFRIKNLQIPLPTYAELRPQRTKVVVSCTTTVPARSSTLVQVDVEIPDGGKQVASEVDWYGVLEPGSVRTDQEWRVPRVVATVTRDAKIPIHVTNISTHSITIPPGTEIGTLYSIQEDGKGLYDVPNAAVASSQLSSGALDDIMSQLDLDLTALSETGKAALRRLVAQYSDVFSHGDGDIGKTQILQHHIETGQAPPVRQRPRRIPVKLREEVERQKEKMLKEGVIEESSSPWCSPIVLAKKKDGSFRFCVDLRAVNAVTQSLPIPLPRVDESLDSLAGAKLFSTLDMASGYWQVNLAEKDREKTAFSTGKGLHQFRAMPFGLKNAGATFQRLMELVLAGLDTKSCLVYIDDIIVFGDTEQAHLRNIEEVFQRIRAAGMKLKPKKCCLAREEVVFLGHKIGKEGVLPDPANVEKVQKWPKPQKSDELKSFLGLAGYYSRFIPNYSDLVRPLREAAETKGRVEWTTERSESFEAVKLKLTSPPILALPTCKGEFKLATDASNTAVGAVLTEVVGGEERVVAYASKVLSKSERRWPAYDKELWAIVWAIRHFRQYLTATKFIVYTDHKPLLNIPSSINVDGDATGRRGRWAIELSTYDVVVQYRKGSENNNADALSRPITEDSDDDSEKLMTTSHTDGPDEICPETLIREQEIDPLFGEVKSWLATGRTPPKKELKRKNAKLRMMARYFDQLFIEGGIIKMKQHARADPVILLPRPYHKIILNMLHDDKTAGHLGTTRTQEKVAARFFWPGMSKDVAHYCETCDVCQRRSRPTPQMQATLRTDTYSRPFERVGIDITEMPMSVRGNKYALVAMDYFSKYVFTYPMPNQTADMVSECLLDMVLRQGVPERLHSDQGRQFESAVFQSLCKRLGIKKTRTSPYRPESDGMVERFNRTLKDMTSKFLKPCGSDWDDNLQFITFAYNTSKHSVTGFTPFFLTHGREARLPVDELFGRRHDVSMIDTYVENSMGRLRDAFSQVTDRISRAASDMAESHDESDREISYEPGQKVWVKDHTANAGGKRKVALYYKGPATIVGRQGSIKDGVTYRVVMPGGKETTVHHNHLKPFETRKPDETTNQPVTGGRLEERQGGSPVETRDEPIISETKEVPSFIWLTGGNTSVDQTSQPSQRYVTRYGRVSKPVIRYPEREQ